MPLATPNLLTRQLSELKIETVAPAREEARDGRIEIFYARLKYAISDYNQKEERWEGFFIYLKKLGNDEKVKCSNVIMCGLAAK